jgi:hypothetical protein
MTTIEDGVRAWARGIYPVEAGAELLIRQRRTIYDGAPWLTEQESSYAPARSRMVAIDVGALLEGTGGYSGGERQLIRIAASLLGGPPVDLSEDVPGLDRANIELVLAAIAHANGSHEHCGIRPNTGGGAVSLIRLPSLHPWPDGTRQHA